MVGLAGGLAFEEFADELVHALGLAPTDMPSARLVGRIPVRNIWFLFLYASDLARFKGQFGAEVENSPDLPTLIARLLCFSVERRLCRNLSRGYEQRDPVLTRARGRIDVLRTFSGDLLRRDYCCTVARGDQPRSAVEEVNVKDGN